MVAEFAFHWLAVANVGKFKVSEWYCCVLCISGVPTCTGMSLQMVNGVKILVIFRKFVSLFLLLKFSLNL